MIWIKSNTVSNKICGYSSLWCKIRDELYLFVSRWSHFACQLWHFSCNTANLHCLMKTGSIAVEMLQSTLKKDSIMRQTNKVHLLAMSNTFVFSPVKHFQQHREIAEFWQIEKQPYFLPRPHVSGKVKLKSLNLEKSLKGAWKII